MSEMQEKRRINITQQVFSSVLLDDKPSSNEIFFHPFAQAANCTLPRFDVLPLCWKCCNEMPSLNEFKPRALSNTVWAFATIDMQHPGLF
jgi:hypothetical protein